MHGGKHHHHGNGHDHGHEHDHGPGHNHSPHPRKVAQWQTPHLPEGVGKALGTESEPDIDLVESAFVEGFAATSDPTSFLRLAQVPFEGVAEDGKRLLLLRVETDAVTDLGSVSPHVGGGSFRYDVLPGRMVTRRERLRIVYFDGENLRPLSLGEARGLAKP